MWVWEFQSWVAGRPTLAAAYSGPSSEYLPPQPRSRISAKWGLEDKTTLYGQENKLWVGLVICLLSHHRSFELYFYNETLWFLYSLWLYNMNNIVLGVRDLGLVAEFQYLLLILEIVSIRSYSTVFLFKKETNFVSCIWELIFIYCRLFVLILVVFFFVVSSHYVSAKFHLWPSSGD